MTLADPQQKMEAHLDNYEAFAASAGGPAWLTAFREAGIRRFDTAGFPGKLDEAWRYTRIRPIVETQWKLLGEADTAEAKKVFDRFTLGDAAAVELVFVNGRFNPELSKLADVGAKVTVGPLADHLNDAEVKDRLGKLADIEANPFVAINAGFVADGGFIKLARSAVVEKPIHLLFIVTPEAEPGVCHPRTLILAEDNAEATLVESYVGPEHGTYFTNAVTECFAGSDCRLNHYKLNQESPEAFHVATFESTIGKQTNFASQSATIGSLITRNDLNVHLAGEYAEAVLNGLVVGIGERHVDNHTLLDHQAPNCPSYELYKHVLDDKSTGIFKGKIFVAKAAQKTDSKQNSRTLLLSDTAGMNSQPALEIYADDVKCSHGSTTGPVDDEAVFYLNSRGVDQTKARRLLTYAFAADLTRRIAVVPIRERLENHLAALHGLPTDLRIQDLAEAREGVVF